jgi:hypothetical protein
VLAAIKLTSVFSRLHMPAIVLGKSRERVAVIGHHLDDLVGWLGIQAPWHGDASQRRLRAGGPGKSRGKWLPLTGDLRLSRQLRAMISRARCS